MMVELTSCDAETGGNERPIWLNIQQIICVEQYREQPLITDVMMSYGFRVTVTGHARDVARKIRTAARKSPD